MPRLSFAAKSILNSLFIVGSFTVLVFFTLTAMRTKTETYDALLAEGVAMQEHIERLLECSIRSQALEKDFLLTKDASYKEAFRIVFAKFEKELELIAVSFQSLENTELNKRTEELSHSAQVYREAFHNLYESWRTMGLDHNSGLQGAFRQRVHELESLFKESGSDKMQITLLQLRRAEKDYLLRRLEKYITKAHGYLNALDSAVVDSELASSEQARIREGLKAYKVSFDDLVAEYEQSEVLAVAMRSSIESLENGVKQLAAWTKKSIAERREQTQAELAKNHLMTLIATIFVIVGSVLFTGLNIRSNRVIMNAIRCLVRDLGAEGERLLKTSGRFAQASRELSQSSGIQSESVHETGASLENIAEMTRSTADNSIKAKNLATQAYDAAQAGSQKMELLSNSMKGIHASSENLSQVIKEINEIAFQTNILALNAAVEAARAGSAGAGFAVVAEEVRNLAQRCAKSASQSQGIIEATAERGREGLGLNEDVAKQLDQIFESTEQVNSLVMDITQGTQEQHSAIAQIKTAVGQIEGLTQRNAQVAGDNAQASEELQEEAVSLNRSVCTLRGLARVKAVALETASVRGLEKEPVLADRSGLMAEQEETQLQAPGRESLLSR